MNDHAITAAVSVVMAVIGLAVVAALVSTRSGTPGVLGAGGSALSNAICKALSPVTGSTCGGSLTQGCNKTCPAGSIINPTNCNCEEVTSTVRF